MFPRRDPEILAAQLASATTRFAAGMMYRVDELLGGLRAEGGGLTAEEAWAPLMGRTFETYMPRYATEPGGWFSTSARELFEAAARSGFTADGAWFARRSFEHAGADLRSFIPGSNVLSYLNASEKAVVFRAHGLFGGIGREFAVTIAARPVAHDYLEGQYLAQRFFYYNLSDPQVLRASGDCELMQERPGKPAELVRPSCQCSAQTPFGEIYMFSTRYVAGAEELNRLGKGFSWNAVEGAVSVPAGEKVEVELARVLAQMYSSTMSGPGPFWRPVINLNVGSLVQINQPGQHPRLAVTALHGARETSPAAFVDSLLSPTGRTPEGSFTGVPFWPEPDGTAAGRFLDALTAGFQPVCRGEAFSVARQCIAEYVQEQEREFSAVIGALCRSCFQGSGEFDRLTKGHLAGNTVLESLWRNMCDACVDQILTRAEFDRRVEEARGLVVPKGFIEELRQL
jgi:hypothetical protein